MLADDPIMDGILPSTERNSISKFDTRKAIIVCCVRWGMGGRRMTNGPNSYRTSGSYSVIKMSMSSKLDLTAVVESKPKFFNSAWV